MKNKGMAIAGVVVVGVLLGMAGFVAARALGVPSTPAAGSESVCDKGTVPLSYDATIYAEREWWPRSVNDAVGEKYDRVVAELAAYSKVSTTAEVNGDDSHRVITFGDNDESAEHIIVDGMGYWKDSWGDSWWAYGEIEDPLIPKCAHVEGLASLGESTTQDGQKATTYAATIPFPYKDESISVLYEYWVDGDGQLLQFRRTNDLLHTSRSRGEVIFQLDGTEVSTLTLSGIGEPNTIEAPATSTPQ